MISTTNRGHQTIKQVTITPAISSQSQIVINFNSAKDPYENGNLSKIMGTPQDIFDTFQKICNGIVRHRITQKKVEIDL